MTGTTKEYYLLRHDQIFKNVFYRDDELLKHFLTDILSNFYSNLKIDTVEVLNTEITKDRVYIRNKTADIFVKAAGKYFNIEINIDSSRRIINRNFFFLTSKLTEYVKKKHRYLNIPEHVQINFNFNGKKKKGFEILGYGNLETGEVTMPFVKTININVDYFTNIWYTTGKTKEFYDKYKNIIVFGLAENDFKSLEDDDKYMKKLVNDVETLNKDPDFYQWMTDEEDIECQVNSSFIEGKEEGIEQGIEQGTRQGIEQGSKEKELDIVRKMKNEKISVEMIQKITGLSVEEINNI